MELRSPVYILLICIPSLYHDIALDLCRGHGAVTLERRPLSLADLEARPGSPPVVVLPGSDSSGGKYPLIYPISLCFNTQTPAGVSTLLFTPYLSVSTHRFRRGKYPLIYPMSLCFNTDSSRGKYPLIYPIPLCFNIQTPAGVSTLLFTPYLCFKLQTPAGISTLLFTPYLSVSTHRLQQG